MARVSFDWLSRRGFWEWGRILIGNVFTKTRLSLTPPQAPRNQQRKPR